MSKILYFLTSFAESGLSIFGLRGTYAAPSYTVVQHLAPGIEIRAYAPRTLVQTAVTSGGDGEAFGKLFRYIAGDNAPGRTVPMTVPVEQTRSDDTPGRTPSNTMSFYLSPAVAADPPIPKDTNVHIVALKAATLGVIRFSGTATEDLRGRNTTRLTQALRQAGRAIRGVPMLFSYDPPFAIPFLRRNEIAIEVAP